MATRRRRTHKDFIIDVQEIVGDEYEVVGLYKNTKTKIEIRHKKCGDIYPVLPSNFLSGSRCPKCFGNKKKTTEDFKQEVFELVGNEYEVVGLYKNTKTKIEIRHKKCGDIYPVLPSNFLSGNSCLKCSREKKTTEDFKQEVFELVGNEYDVVGTYESARTKIEMRHHNCGDIYFTNPSNFLSGSRCPKCFGNKKKTTEDFKQEVFELVGDEYKIIGIYKNSYTKIEMQHKNCGEIYLVRPCAFSRGNRCPKCRESKGERRISEWLDSKGILYTPQSPIKYSRGKCPLRFDFLAQGVAVEYDGELHFKAVEHFGGEEGLRKTQRRDRIKDKYCADNGIPLIRIPYWEYDNIDAILTEKLLPLLTDNAKSTQQAS